MKLPMILETMRAYLSHSEPGEKPYWFGIVNMILLIAVLLGTIIYNLLLLREAT